MQSFKEVKKRLQAKGLVSLRNREIDPYKYTANGSTVRRREAGEVFAALLKLTGEQYSAPVASWSGKWPRTKASWQAENQGAAIFWGLYLQAEWKGLI